MYLSEKPRPIDFYKEEGRDMMMEVVSNGGLQPQQQQQHQQMILADSSGEDHEVKAPKKRAETWVQEETRSLISLRREMDLLFNTSKSNKHLWEQISAKMREKGFDRSPTMCTDKWRNLLKEYKKARQHERGSGSAKMSYYKEIDDLLRERNKNAPYKSPTPPKVDSYMQFSDKEADDILWLWIADYAFQYSRHAAACIDIGIEDAAIPFGSVEATGRSMLNLERRLDHDGHPLAITAADAVGANGVTPWNWRDAPANEFSHDINHGLEYRPIRIQYGHIGSVSAITDTRYRGVSASIKEKDGKEHLTLTLHLIDLKADVREGIMGA
ncbi:hypothetical protein ACLOJK_012072 [Asimina triloba]